MNGRPVLRGAPFGTWWRGSQIEARHVAEILAGMTDLPPIGAASTST